MKKRRRMGYVAVRPSDYVVHSRRGRVIRQGMGRSFFYLPATDRFCILPCTNNSIGFCADQITRENQGVEVTGFAIWKIAHPEATWLRFDFDGERDPIEAIGQYLKDVVESAIRHQVANMSIEDVLRKRATIILELKRELAYITGQWGLEIDTIEVKGVKIMSSELFANLQARYRDAVRLESETSTISTERAIEEQRIAQQEELAARRADADAREAERRHEAELAALRLQTEREAARLAEKDRLKGKEAALALARTQKACAQRLEELAALTGTKDAEAALQAADQALELQAGEHRSAMAAMAAGDERTRLEALNTEGAVQALFRSLPSVAGVLQGAQVNLGDDALRVLVQGLRRVLGTRPVGRTRRGSEAA